jgi:HSP20 family molecular chaperone IbpA
MKKLYFYSNYKSFEFDTFENELYEKPLENNKYIFGKNTEDNVNCPPYNSWVDENNNLFIEVAVVGFTKEEIKITFDGVTLKITGLKEKENKENRKYIEKKLEVLPFTCTLSIKNHRISDDYYRRNYYRNLVDVTLNCGILTMKFEKINRIYKIS